MRVKYEYKFLRLKGRKKRHYQKIISEQSRKGWRLAQIFTPGAKGFFFSPRFFELIFERET